MKTVRLEKMWSGWMRVVPVDLALNKENANLIDAINDKILKLDETAARELISAQFKNVRIVE